MLVTDLDLEQVHRGQHSHIKESYTHIDTRNADFVRETGCFEVPVKTVSVYRRSWLMVPIYWCRVCVKWL